MLCFWLIVGAIGNTQSMNVGDRHLRAALASHRLPRADDPQGVIHNSVDHQHLLVAVEREVVRAGLNRDVASLVASITNLYVCPDGPSFLSFIQDLVTLYVDHQQGTLGAAEVRERVLRRCSEFPFPVVCRPPVDLTAVLQTVHDEAFKMEMMRGRVIRTEGSSDR